MNRYRRSLVVLGAGGLLSPHLVAREGTVRLAWISVGRKSDLTFLDALRSGLRELGYVSGAKNFEIEEYWAEGETAQLDALAGRLLPAKPQIVVTQGPVAITLLKAGASMPVVFGFSGDPVEAGLADSLSRPGRNFTGMSFLALDLVGKRIELLKELLPGIRRVAILARPQHPGERREFSASKDAADRLGIQLEYFPLLRESELPAAMATAAKTGCSAAVAFPDAIIMNNAANIAAHALKHRIPVVSGWSQFADAGNVLTYGPVLRDAFARLATFVDRILRGARPADLPVELPAVFELVVNLRAARALGMKVPQSILLRADRVIE